MKLKDKVAIITGSTSGMGRASAFLFAREGAKVVVTGRNEERAKAVVDQIKAEGNEAIYIIADASNADEAETIFNKTMEAYGTVDVLFNNAGALSTSPFMEVSMDEWRKLFEVNVHFTMRLTQLAGKVMKEKGKGVVVNTSSVAAFEAHHGFAPYVSSKFAVNGLTRSMAFELGPEIRVNAIAPGLIMTAMVEEAASKDDTFIKTMTQQSPLKRAGQPEDIATVALFLASDDSAYVNGQILRVDGGFGV